LTTRDIIGKYERGENSPSIEMAIKLSDVLSVSVDYLLGKEGFSSYYWTFIDLNSNLGISN